MSNNSFLSQTATTVVFIDFSVSKYHTLQTGIVEGVSNETKLITQIFGLKSVMDKGLVNK